MSTPVAIFGAAGYGGIELLRLLLAHPKVEVAYLGDPAWAGKKISEVYPHLLGVTDLVVEEPSIEIACERAEAIILALPHGIGIPMVAQALEAGKQVLDFSADWRLHDPQVYGAYYGEHAAPELLGQAVYGLPELHREQVRATKLCAVPGCYPTSAILGLAPALKHGLIQTDGLIIDSKSGVSGAGRSKLDLLYHFPEANESVLAYAIGTHRHTPEIDQELSGAAGVELKVTFTPHLIPISRGILSTCYAQYAPGATLAQAQEAYAEFYAPEPFVQVLEPGKLPRTKHVRGSNFCHIGLAEDAHTGRLIIVSVIDNLLKGLAGASVQCLNLMNGWEETTGLTAPPVWP